MILVKKTEREKKRKYLMTHITTVFKKKEKKIDSFSFTSMQL